MKLFERLDKFISKIEEDGKEYIVTRDMNCDIFKPKDNNTKHLKKVYADHHLTSDTRTLIDHIATNKPEYVSKSGVIACGISDHELAFVNRSTRIPKMKKDTIIVEICKLKLYDSVRKRRSDHCSEQIEQNSGDMKRMWKILQQTTNKESKIGTIDNIVSDNHEITDKALISEAFNQHFSLVPARLVVIQPNSSKATGMHNLPNKILKLTKDVIANSLSNLCNACIHASMFPNDFKMARVAPIFKSDGRENFNHYKLTSLLTTGARVFKRLIYEQSHN